MKNKRNFLKQASILTLATFFAKFIGAFYRIPLTNILGAEGMGIYQLIFPIYSLILASSSGALPIAISILVSKKLAMGEESDTKDLLKYLMSVLLLTSVIMAIALVLISKPLSILQQNESTRLGYIAIAPAVVFVSGIAVLRGWFQGNHNMTPSAISQISEGVFKLLIGLSLAVILAPIKIEYAVWGALFGVMVSEIVTFIIMYIMYRKENPPIKLTLKFGEAKEAYKEMVKISLPLTVGALIMPLSQFFDSIIVVNLLMSAGDSVSVATASYGLFTGPVSSLINLPIVAALSIGIAVVPQLSKIKTERNIVAIKRKSDSTIKVALAIGIPFVFIYGIMAGGIIKLLYPNLSANELSLAGKLLQISAISVLMLTLMQIMTSLMQGLGFSYRPVITLSIGIVIKIVLNFILIPILKIQGVAVASIIAFSLVAMLNYFEFKKLIGKSQTLFKNASVISICGVIMGTVVLIIHIFMESTLAIILSLTLGLILYLIVLLAVKVFTDDELSAMPFGKILKKVSGFFGKNA